MVAKRLSGEFILHALGKRTLLNGEGHVAQDSGSSAVGVAVYQTDCSHSPQDVVKPDSSHQSQRTSSFSDIDFLGALPARRSVGATSRRQTSIPTMAPLATALLLVLYVARLCEGFRLNSNVL